MTPVSLPSPSDQEVLVASVSLHSQQPPRPLPRQSVCSYASDRSSSRPPSRDGSDRREKERAPMAKEAKRLFKQRSQESFKDNHKSVTSIPYIDASPPSSASLGQSNVGKGWTPTSGGGGGGGP